MSSPLEPILVTSGLVIKTRCIISLFCLDIISLPRNKYVIDKSSTLYPSQEKNRSVQMDKTRYLKIQEVAELTRLKPKTIREYCSRKLIPHIKLRAAVIFDERDIIAWLESSKVKVIRQIPLKEKENV